MKTIKLSNGREVMVDDEDFETLSLYKWSPSGKAIRPYAARGKGNSRNGTHRSIMMHRVLASAQKGDHVDHIDGNTLNNQKANLRRCSHGQNIRNGKLRSCNKSGFKGVSFIATKKKFAAHIKLNYKSKFLGYFHDAKEAAAAYNEAALRLFGDFARINPL